MQYLEEIEERHIDKKKVVGARVSEDVLAALNSASDDMHLFGYDFSITKVIEKALDNTLSEINERTHLDYYKLVKFERKIKDIDDDPTFPFSKEIITAEPSQYSEDLKHEFLSQFEFKEEQKDFDSFLENWEKDLLKQWNKILKPHDIEISNKGNEYIMIGSDGKSKFVL